MSAVLAVAVAAALGIAACGGDDEDGEARQAIEERAEGEGAAEEPGDNTEEPGDDAEDVDEPGDDAEGTDRGEAGEEETEPDEEGTDRAGSYGGGQSGGTAPTAVRRCGDVAFKPNSDAGAFGVKARGTDCDTARDVAADAETAQGQSYESEGFACTGERQGGPLPTVRYTCRGDDDAVVVFEAS